MPIASLPLDPTTLRSVVLRTSQDVSQATGIRVADTWRTPVRDESGRFLPFRWFGE